MEYRVIIDYERNNFCIIITRRFVLSLNPYNDLRTCRYNKAIVNIPRIVFPIQQAVSDINKKNETTQENAYNPAQKLFSELEYDDIQTDYSLSKKNNNKTLGKALIIMSIVGCIVLVGFIDVYFNTEEESDGYKKALVNYAENSALNYDVQNDISNYTPNYDMPNDNDMSNYTPNYDMPSESVKDYYFYENSMYNFSFHYPVSVYIREETEQSVILDSNDGSGVFTVACLETDVTADENTFEYYSNAVMANYYKKAQKDSLKYNVYYPENNIYIIESAYVGAQTDKQWKLNFALVVLEGNMYYIGGLYEFDDNASDNIFKNMFDSFARNKGLVS